jgi:predicted GNAT family acetyltransferase/MFS family permease
VGELMQVDRRADIAVDRVVDHAVGRRVTAVARRFAVLTALRWLPTGLLMPILVVLKQERGLSLGQVGMVFAVQGAVVLVLELPTGGLADALGRRPVLVAASAFDVGALALLAVARTPLAFVVAAAAEGVYRALESGPLEAWFVDATHAVDPRADIEAGLGRAGTAAGGAIAVGALAAAGVTAWWPAGAGDVLAVPVVAAIGARLVDTLALARLMTERRRTGGRPLAALRSGVAAVPHVVRGTLRLVGHSRALRCLVAVELSWGAGLVAVELLSAPRLVELVGDTTGGVTAFAVAVAGAWSASAVGAALAGRATAVAGGSAFRLGAWLRVAQGGATAMIALVAGPVAMIAGYLGFYVVHGMANVVHYGLVHRFVGPGERTTVLSVHSLTARAGGIAAGLVLAPLAARAGIGWALLAAAVVLAAAAPLYGIARRPAPEELPGAAARVGHMATEVRDAEEHGRYEVLVDGALAGFAQYRDDAGVRVFTHTEVFDAFEGQGVGSALAAGALDLVRAAGLRIVALCPFIASYVERHPEQADLVDAAADRRVRAAVE